MDVRDLKLGLKIMKVEVSFLAKKLPAALNLSES